MVLLFLFVLWELYSQRVANMFGMVLHMGTLPKAEMGNVIKPCNPFKHCEALIVKSFTPSPTWDLPSISREHLLKVGLLSCRSLGNFGPEDDSKLLPPAILFFTFGLAGQKSWRSTTNPVWRTLPRSWTPLPCFFLLFRKNTGPLLWRLHFFFLKGAMKTTKMKVGRVHAWSTSNIPLLPCRHE